MARKTNVKQLRKVAGLTQLDLALLMGVSGSMASHWETGRHSLTPENAYLFKLILAKRGVIASLEQIFGFEVF